MIVYDPFWQFLKDNGITTYTLINTYGISKGLIARMKHNEPITTYTNVSAAIGGVGDERKKF